MHLYPELQQKLDSINKNYKEVVRHATLIKIAILDELAYYAQKNMPTPQKLLVPVYLSNICFDARKPAGLDIDTYNAAVFDALSTLQPLYPSINLSACSNEDLHNRQIEPDLVVLDLLEVVYGS